MRLESLDLDLKASPRAVVDGSGSHAVIHDGFAELRLDADPTRGLEDAIATVMPPGNPYHVTITEKTSGAEGWKLAYVLRWPAGAPGITSTGIVRRRRVGTLEVECSTMGPDEALVSRADEMCMSLTPVPGGIATVAGPVGDPLLRVSSVGGQGGIMSALSIWADGRIEFHGPRCSKRRGPARQLDKSRTQALLASIERSGFEELPAQVGRLACVDCPFDELELRAGSRWKRVKVLQSDVPTPVCEMITQIAQVAADNPCSD